MRHPLSPSDELDAFKASALIPHPEPRPLGSLTKHNPKALRSHSWPRLGPCRSSEGTDSRPVSKASPETKYENELIVDKATKLHLPHAQLPISCDDLSNGGRGVCAVETCRFLSHGEKLREPLVRN